MGEMTLRDAALSIYGNSINKFLGFSNNDKDLNVAGYWLQQSVELFIKHYLEINGIKCPATSDVSVLIETCRQNGSPLQFTENIISLAETLNIWGTQTMNVRQFIIDKEGAKFVVNIVKEFFLLNGATSDELQSKGVTLDVFN